MAVVLVCAVCLLVAGGAQAVNVNEEKASKEVVASTTNIQTIAQSAKTETVNETKQSESDEPAETAVSEPEQEYITYFTENDAVDLAKVLVRECGGVSSKTEQACVAWCVLNRVDEYGSSVYDVLREPNQFAFRESAEVREDLYELAKDVLQRWNDEKMELRILVEYCRRSTHISTETEFITTSETLLAVIMIHGTILLKVPMKIKSRVYNYIDFDEET